MATEGWTHSAHAKCLKTSSCESEWADLNMPSDPFFKAIDFWPQLTPLSRAESFMTMTRAGWPLTSPSRWHSSLCPSSNLLLRCFSVTPLEKHVIKPFKYVYNHHFESQTLIRPNEIQKYTQIIFSLFLDMFRIANDNATSTFVVQYSKTVYILHIFPYAKNSWPTDKISSIQ